MHETNSKMCCTFPFLQSGMTPVVLPDARRRELSVMVDDLNRVIQQVQQCRVSIESLIAPSKVFRVIQTLYLPNNNRSSRGPRTKAGR